MLKQFLCLLLILFLLGGISASTRADDQYLSAGISGLVLYCISYEGRVSELTAWQINYGIGASLGMRWYRDPNLEGRYYTAKLGYSLVSDAWGDFFDNLFRKEDESDDVFIEFGIGYKNIVGEDNGSKAHFTFDVELNGGVVELEDPSFYITPTLKLGVAW